VKPIRSENRFLNNPKDIRPWVAANEGITMRVDTFSLLFYTGLALGMSMGVAVLAVA
jgi:hypothetical protein